MAQQGPQCPIRNHDSTAGHVHPGTRQEAGGLRVAFGAGAFKCPGRALALAQASLSIAVFFACTDAHLCSSELCKNVSGGDGTGASASEAEASMLPTAAKAAPRWLQLDVLPGAHIVARGVISGDPQSQLPRFDARQLVGVKKPIEALYAECMCTVHANQG